MTRCGVAAVVGAPNAGKSTLINLLVGSKISIATPKPQTTRAILRGIFIEGEAQIILVDTPGIFEAKAAFEKAMVQAAWNQLEAADAVLLVVDVERPERSDKLVEELIRRKKRVTLVLNKIDRMKDKSQLLALVERFQHVTETAWMISARKGEGVEELKRHMAGMMKASPWLYPEDAMTDVPMRVLAAEITREHLMMNLEEELPYAIHVETEMWEEKKDGSLKIHQRVDVQRDGQKKIVLGEKGAMIKKIGTASRHALESLLERKVHLFLHVKVSERWKEDRELMRRMGL